MCMKWNSFTVHVQQYSQINTHLPSSWLFLLSNFCLRVLGDAAGLKSTQHLTAGQICSLHQQLLSVYCGKEGQKHNEMTHKNNMLKEYRKEMFKSSLCTKVCWPVADISSFVKAWLTAWVMLIVWNSKTGSYVSECMNCTYAPFPGLYPIFEFLEFFFIIFVSRDISGMGFLKT